MFSFEFYKIFGNIFSIVHLRTTISGWTFNYHPFQFFSLVILHQGYVFPQSVNNIYIICKIYMIHFNLLSANLTKWSNTLKQFVRCCRWIVCVCLTILWAWRLKDQWYSYGRTCALLKKFIEIHCFWRFSLFTQSIKFL